MKRLMIVGVGILLAVSVLGLGMPGEQQAVAVSGCCKQRQDNGPWREINSDLKRCKIENDAERDDLFRPSGRIWWDMSC